MLPVRPVHLNKREWELTEIQRSAYEAAHTPDASLGTTEANIARYINPSMTTVYPLEYAFALLGDVRGRTVLDFGCGSGENSLLLARRGARVIGVDISEKLIRVARRRLAVNGVAGQVEFVVASAHHLPLGNECIDVVLGMAILHHLDLAASAREIERILKPGGKAIFKEPVRDSRLLRILRKLIPYHSPNVSPGERPLTTPELHEFASPFQFSSMRAFCLPFVTLLEHLPHGGRVQRSTYRLDGAMMRWLPEIASLAGVRVFEIVKNGTAVGNRLAMTASTTS